MNLFNLSDEKNDWCLVQRNEAAAESIEAAASAEKGWLGAETWSRIASIGGFISGIPSNVANLAFSAITKTPALQTQSPIYYSKGEIKTNKLVPTGEEIGRGKSGHVYEHGLNQKLVVKKSKSSLQHEYKIGQEMEHETLVKTHQLFIKQYSPGNECFKLVMDKVNGDTITSYYMANVLSSKIPRENIVRLILDALDCSLYLYDHKITWFDVNNGNIMIEKETFRLKLVDYEYWRSVEDSSTLTYHLIAGAMEITLWLMKSSTMRNPEIELSEEQRERESAIVFPERFVGQKVVAGNIRGLIHHKEKGWTWEGQLMQRIKSTPEEKKKQLIINYFNSVLDAFHQLYPKENNS
jgi:serine/threonine protein kinase